MYRERQAVSSLTITHGSRIYFDHLHEGDESHEEAEQQLLERERAAVQEEGSEKSRSAVNRVALTPRITLQHQEIFDQKDFLDILIIHACAGADSVSVQLHFQSVPLRSRERFIVLQQRTCFYSFESQYLLAAHNATA